MNELRGLTATLCCMNTTRYQEMLIRSICLKMISRMVCVNLGIQLADTVPPFKDVRWYFSFVLSQISQAFFKSIGKNTI